MFLINPYVFAKQQEPNVYYIINKYTLQTTINNKNQQYYLKQKYNLVNTVDSVNQQYYLKQKYELEIEIT